MAMNLGQFLRFFEMANQCFEANLNELSRLDSALGDGDHGMSMLKGFKCISAAIANKPFASISDLLSVAGRTLMREIGGSCGPLFAMIFIQGAQVAKDKAQMQTADLARMFGESGARIMALGKSARGDKTMLDALLPAADVLQQCAEEGVDAPQALARAADAAMDGAKATEDMLATKGRGRYQGENSLGHMDPGAMSVALILRTLAQAAVTTE